MATTTLPLSQHTLASTPQPTSNSLHSTQVTDLGSTSADSSRPSSPDSRQVGPIPEEDEDETSSEAANEPITPTDVQHPHQHAHVISEAPLIINTVATPASTGKKNQPYTLRSPKTDETPSSNPLATWSNLPSKESSLKGRVSKLFRRSNSHVEKLNINSFIELDHPTLTNNNGSDPMLGREHRRVSIRRLSTSTTPFTSRSNTPPSPACPSDRGSQESVSFKGASKENLNMTKKQRSSTGLGLRDKLQRHGPKISFAQPETENNNLAPQRSSSVDWDPSNIYTPQPVVQEIPRQIWGMAAETGIGLKSRRLSVSLPDDFTVDVVELDEEYAPQSKLIGRRGKSIGKGATAHVKLMVRKGCSSDIYAVKEFRGKSTTEKEEDYEKKVKSEFSIAQSARHPNIVETFRLCTHNGRWNHVMEYCEQGDLFGLVNQKYLNKEDHAKDRQCLFKQLIQGLSYLHSNGIAHRDVKLENLLITKDSKLKITDFGVSEVFAGIHPGLRAASGKCGKDMGEVRLCAPGICGSPPYIAPEVIEKKGEYDPRPLDVWGAAIVMLCMTANGCLWAEAKPNTSPLYDELVRGWEKWNSKHITSPIPTPITDTDYPHVSFFDKHINPPALRRILLTMLNPDPARRATIAEIAKNRWLKNVECCQVDSYEGPKTLVDVSKSRCLEGGGMARVVAHNHLPPLAHHGHKFVRLPGSTDM
ncbi:kinase domain containing protein [Rutstroemia sp. NJR-2017a BBW]|nr:kinase domain containing protein [Rutstroemia sp. NJR-2017a BBW]